MKLTPAQREAIIDAFVGIYNDNTLSKSPQQLEAFISRALEILESKEAALATLYKLMKRDKDGLLIYNRDVCALYVKLEHALGILEVVPKCECNKDPHEPDCLTTHVSLRAKTDK